MKDQSGTAIIPFLGTWWSALLRSGNRRPVDRALGAAATLGFSIAILRLISQALRSAKQYGEERGEPNSLYPLIRGILRGILLGEKEEEEEETLLVKYRGSCHCQAIHFELLTPRILRATDSPGKIRYPRVRIAASDFKFKKGTEHVQMYYVEPPSTLSSKEGGDGVVAAHTFCTRCGVHILHAANSHSNLLDVNANCLDSSKLSIKVLRETEQFASGVPVEGQWDQVSSEADEEEKVNGADISHLGSFRDEPLFPQDSHYTSNGTSSLKIPEVANNSVTVSPGTPTTSTTSGSDSFVSAMRVRSLVLEQDSSAASVESESTESLTVPLTAKGISTFAAPGSSSLPHLTTTLPATLESSSSSTATTPMMRDQMKYYMRKHLKASSTTESPANE